MRLTGAAVFSTCFEAVLYGLSVFLFILTLWVLLRNRKERRVNWGMVSASSALLLFSSLQEMGVNMFRLYAGFVSIGPGLPGGPEEYFQDVSRVSCVLKSALLNVQTLILDGVVIYRTYKVWNNVYIVVVPVISWLCFLASDVGVDYSLAMTSPDSPSVWATNTARWIIANLVVALFANLTATLALAYRIWQVTRESAQYRTEGYLLPFLRIILGSGALYTVTISIALVLFLIGSNGVYVVLDMISPIISIVFNMIIVRVGLAADGALIPEPAKPVQPPTQDGSRAMPAVRRMFRRQTDTDLEMRDINITVEIAQFVHEDTESRSSQTDEPKGTKLGDTLSGSFPFFLPPRSNMQLLSPSHWAEVVFNFVYVLVQHVIIWLFKPPPPPGPEYPRNPQGRIAVIGAGLTGVSSAAHAIAHGFDVVIYEQSDTVEIRRIWKEYQLEPRTRFNTPVKSVRRVEGTGNHLQDDPSGSQSRWIINGGEDGEFDAVVVTVGTCGEPMRISFPGLPSASRNGSESETDNDDKHEGKEEGEVFEGDVIHSSELDNAHLEGKRILVIGSGASGVESVETALSKGAKSCVMIARDDKWIIPRNMVVDTLISAQPFGREMPLSFIWEKIVTWWNYCGAPELVPARIGLFESTPVVNDEFVKIVKSGKCQYVRGDIERFTRNAVRVKVRGREDKPGEGKEEKEYEGDVVVLATGFKKPQLTFFKENLFPEGYDRPNLYLQNFSTEDWSVLMTNSAYQNAIGTVGHFHIGIYMRILMVFLMDPDARPTPKDMKLWVDVIRFVKRGARGGALSFFTYMELTIWLLLFHVFRLDRLKWMFFIMQGWGVYPEEYKRARRQAQFKRHVFIWLFKPPPPPSPEYLNKPKGRIAVIGAGVTGISSAAHAVAHGFDVVIYEQGDSVGGIWTRVNETSGLQINSLLYRFHPAGEFGALSRYDASTDFLPEVRRVWREYQLEPRTRFNTPVTSVRRGKGTNPEHLQGNPFGSGSRWIINGGEDGTFDAVVATVGACGALARGNFPGLYFAESTADSSSESDGAPEGKREGGEEPETYRGDVLHSSELDGACFEGRRVLVVGSGASGIEAVETALAQGAKGCIMIARDDKWILPRNLLVNALIGIQPVSREMVSWLTWEKVITWWSYRGAPELVPARIGLFETTPVVNDEFVNLVRNGRCEYVRGDIVRFTRDGVRVKVRGRQDKPGDGKLEKEFKGDMVVLATGFQRPELDFFKAKLFPKGYSGPSVYLQGFSTEDWSVLLTNVMFQHGLGTVGQVHIGIYMRILLMFLMDPATRPTPQEMKLWVDFVRFIKRGAPGGAFTFFTYTELRTSFYGLVGFSLKPMVLLM
ncbi:hypothetical protein BN946_scf185016.g16 [Trametes cinnabarina]|uniref:FAD/NAD(P)-binding domain-containing protein n=1 Tax=Pycnoporus cinnabarinus TaxID=5643 RepID=A0A060SNS6_PYCCI|nr:hypothetical protein BN946_scf185016.g16 [Trametes cinnabarina]